MFGGGRAIQGALGGDGDRLAAAFDEVLAFEGSQRGKQRKLLDPERCLQVIDGCFLEWMLPRRWRDRGRRVPRCSSDLVESVP